MLKKYQKILASLLGAGVLIAAIFFLSNKRSFAKPKICFKKSCFNVEIADSNEEKTRGLMLREKLNENSGMLFIFEQEDIHSFWMKNTKIPLDMVWLNKNKEVVFIYENAQPCPDEGVCPTITPDKSALYVLEINAGLIDKNGIEIDGSADFKL